MIIRSALVRATTAMVEAMVGVRLSESERRSAIVRAAHRIAVRDGLAMVSGRSVAAEAELSSGLVYFYFSTKLGLLHALLHDVIGRALDGPATDYGADLEPHEALQSMVASEIRDLKRQRDDIELLFQFFFVRRDEEFRSEVNAGLHEYGRRLQPVIARFAALHGLDSRSITDAMLAAIQGAGVELVRHPQGYDAERIIAGLRDMPQFSAEGCCR
ncbi:TetR family transcriptional regulator [Pseudoclavibacter sp. CFCC 14310]|nr:TetR family transcriptional regulator [Pseudoclavibacter sp. CFCC 14310]KAB1645972.1 TetR family transcriptional regulator [Pseudoclavibacter sp. CFCC 14310]